MDPAQPPSVPLTGPSSGPTSTEEMNMIITAMLSQMESNFAVMSSRVIDKIDQMSARIDELEETVQDLMQRSGVTEEEVLKFQQQRREEKEKQAQQAKQQQ